MENRFIAAILFASLLFPIAGAASMPGDDMQALLDLALNDAQCRITFETGVMNAIIDNLPFTSSLLNPRIDDLESDGSKLNNYASNGDAKNYSIYLHETFSKHLNQNQDAVKEGFESMKNESGMDKNETKDAMESLSSSYKSLKEDLGSCFDNEEYANLVSDHYNNSLNRYQMRAQNLTDRGINASNLLDLVDDARSKILVPMQEDINSASNSSQFRMILNKYCMYDGCANGLNFHMAAKFETMRLSDLLAAMSPKADEAGLTINVSNAKASLDSAKSGIDSWGAEDASPDQLKEVWTDINDAAKASHGIFIALNSSADAD